MIKGRKGALLAPALGALLMVAAPGVALGAPAHADKPPADSQGPGAGAHSGRSGRSGEHRDSHAADPGDTGGRHDNAWKGDRPKDPDAGNPPPKADRDKNPDAARNPDRDRHRDSHAGSRHDNWYGHYDHNRYGYHGHHNWDTHRRYYRYGYHGPGYYDDCGYYGPNGYEGYYDSPDACDWQYGGRGQSLRSNLSGDQEVGRPGAPDSFGTANLFVDPDNGRLCYRLGYDGISRVTMAHIHRGGPGQVGDPVIDLHPEANGDEGCVGADPTALRNLAAHPEAFYLNLHTAEYPEGAMRGQLYDTDRY